MFTISDIFADVDRGIMSHNMVEDIFSYRLIYFVNEGDKGLKHYTDTSYGSLRKSLESVIRKHLSLTNSFVIAQATALKNGQCICLQSRSYAFSLEGYFRQINGEFNNGGRNGNIAYARYASR